MDRRAASRPPPIEVIPRNLSSTDYWSTVAETLGPYSLTKRRREHLGGEKMFRSKLLLSLAALAACLPVTAAIVNVDLSGATTGTTITAPGASFAQTFAGQTVSG